MPDALAPVRAGEPLRISASVYNNLLSLLRARQVDHAAAGDTGQSRRCANTTAWVRNNASTTLERYSPVGIDGYSFTVNHELILHGNTLGSNHVGRWGIAQEPIPPGQLGLVTMAGIAYTSVAVRSDKHRCADVQYYAGAYRLVSAAWGAAQIVCYTHAGTVIRFPADPTPIMRFGIMTSETTGDGGVYVDIIENLLDPPVDRVAVYPKIAGRAEGLIPPGTKVVVACNADTGRYFLVDGGVARMIICQATWPFTTASWDIQCRYVAGFDGDDPVDPGETIYVINTGGMFSGAVGATVLAMYEPAQNRYYAFQVSCPG